VGRRQWPDDRRPRSVHFWPTMVALIRFKVSRIWGWEIVRTSVKCHPMINRKDTKNGPTVSELLSFVTLSN
jgi:hypothetical protein